MRLPHSRFPLAEKARCKERDAPEAEYRELQRRLGLERVVVLPTAYGKATAARSRRSQNWAPDEKTRNRILSANPAELYGFALT